MMFRKFKKTKADENEDRLRVLLALADQELAEPGPCPDPNDMAAFAQGSIDPQKRKIIEVHLKICPECHEEYRNFAAVFKKMSQQSILSQVKKVALDLVERFNISRSFLTTGLTATATACLLLLFWGLQSPTLSDQLAKTYTPKVLTIMSIRGLKSNSMLTLPWERPETILGFVPLQHVDPNALLAFGAGICSAIHDLGGESEKPPPAFMSKPWPDTQWAVDYWLGRWSYLTRAAAISGELVDKFFWQKQIAIVNQIWNQYAAAHMEDEETVDIVNVRLNRIKTILGESDNEILSLSIRDQLSAELDLLIELLSPDKEVVYPQTS